MSITYNTRIGEKYDPSPNPTFITTKCTTEHHEIFLFLGTFSVFVSSLK